ncbi:thioredoxin-dependent thiol peroxidase [archaeon]|jgi:thioredoxin-dependent peroxiredoxin|nr:thioredoxin-dependent thiol peroxidase [archaeon]MBT3720751.1 thioredoxin-dependent thiol peroxidase [archaeon]MBT4022494.1 thioredoxin-dependent thiol peroxidase [archaeon]MBT4272333.1 thioredoxin-dependent thiol peroxidase [archaeon]MBT4460442.1 thioredoxin-dependent thiol peroxidase [archaeon]
MLKIGKKAPDFELLDQNGVMHKLSNYNKTVILYFYPKDDTPGCTKEACNFRDDFSKYKKQGVTIFGMSGDSIEKHKKFSEKYSLPFILLSDPEKSTIKKYGAFGEKKFMGRSFQGIKRMTYVIKKGIIKHVFEKVKVKEHSDEILRLI